ncbi:hypothetical protein [Paenibacillus sp. GCM10027626]|uniref:hypothetical protein n=1 Tax=Paenibacillus sp. GCM10027626 TaxID=3273411 RepID=UPI003631C2DA
MFTISPGGNVAFTKQGAAVGPTVNSGLNPKAEFVTLTVVADTNTLRGYVNGNLLITVTDSAWSSGYFSLITFNNSSSFKNVRLSGAVPDAPSGLAAASPAGSQSVRLSWTAANNANAYRVKRSETVGGPFTPIGTVSGDTTFVDNYALKSKSYYYVVTALDSLGAESSDSNLIGPITASY